MNEHKVSRLVVVEDELKGIVTYSDVVSASPALRPRRLEGEEKFFRHQGTSPSPESSYGFTWGAS